MWNHLPSHFVGLLERVPAATSYRIAWLANSFTGPLYREWDVREGLTRPEFVVLLWLAQVPGLTAQQIAGPSSLPKNSISRAVARLLASGRIHRTPHPQDSRAAQLTLTEAGRTLHARLLPELMAREQAMLAPLDARERARLLALLDKLTVRDDGWGLEGGG